MKCVVTGAAGFIGSHLCERLIEEGHDVLGIDNMSNGKMDNLESLRSQKRFRLRTADINDKYWDMPPTDVIFHLAAKADIVPSITQPLDYHETNVNGTLTMLEHARRTKAKFIYAASSSCYGDNPPIPTKETGPCNPRYPYALTKRVGEQYVLHWGRVYKLNVTSMRLFNVYGPRARTNGTYGAVFGTFLAQLANGKPVTIVGEGNQTRDFTFVSDVVDALVKATRYNRSGAIFNIGSGDPRSILSLAQNLGAGEKVFLPERPGEPEVTHANNSKAQKEIGWSPKVSFEEGCEIMKGLINQFKDAPVWTSDKIAEATAPWMEALS